VVTRNTSTGNQGGGIVLLNGSDNNQIVGNVTTNNLIAGIRVRWTTGELQSVNNLISNNTLYVNALSDIEDQTSGSGTAGTGNTYVNNRCASSEPAGLCVPQRGPP
jgi:hypothetical protein